MEILEYKSQNLIVKNGQTKTFLIPIFDSKEDSISININIEENASAQVYLLGILAEGSATIQLNSMNLGVNSFFDANAGFIQFGNSIVDFTGLMKIENGAKDSDASFRAESLLLSPHARANLVPSLEIEENDVHAGHGAVVKSVDPEQIFYLRSRGLPLDVANELLIKGFLSRFDVKLPQKISDKFNLIISNELSKGICPLDCEWCEK